MITKLFLISTLFFTTISCECIESKKVETKSDVIAHCVDQEFKFDPQIHERNWYLDLSLKNPIKSKYPYFIMRNGSLLVKDISKRKNDFICVVTNKLTNTTFYTCGTNVIIIYPLKMNYAPINETVQYNSSYTILCNAAGGNYANIKISYLVNDVKITHNRPFRIVNDTKIECRISSGKEVLVTVAYIKVKRNGTMTDEESFLEMQCGYIRAGPCAKIFSQNSTRLFNKFHKSHLLVDDLLDQLFSSLDNNITPEYYEGKCVDRFKRLVCSTFYPHCVNNTSQNFGRRPICRESCESIRQMICRRAITDIDKFVLQLTNKFTYVSTSGDVVPSYINQFVEGLKSSAWAMLNCDLLPDRTSGSVDKCDLIDLDDIYRLKEKAESKCFNGIGRNYYGQITNSEKSIRCLHWNQISEIYTSFYQQDLQNQSNYCRNPGGIFKTPMCATSLKKNQTHLRIRDVIMVPCSNIGDCKFIESKLDLASGANNYLPIVIVILVTILVVIIILFTIKYCQRQKPMVKKHETYEIIPLNGDEINIYTNKVYKNTQTGGISCPIYNAAHFEKVLSLGKGEYGEIVLVQAVIDNINSICIENNNNFDKFNKPPKRQRLTKSSSGSDTRSVDDLILSVDKTFNEKPCWPFDKSTRSGCCPFAVIKYSSGLENEQKDSRFNKETKILSQLNHTNILRFYGICLHVSNKISCRIVEYLPNGDIKSILTGRRRLPTKSTNHDNNNNKPKNGYPFAGALKKSRSLKSDDSIKLDDESRLFKRKANCSTSICESERPVPTDNIELSHRQLLKWGIEICDAIVYLHTRHFIHRDIATRNCLVGMNLEAKLADFSFVQKFSYGFDLIGHPNEFIPIRWLPKETLEDIIYNTSTDVWMFGVFLWELMSLGKDPYSEYDLNEVYDAIVNDVKLQKPDNCPLEIYEEMEQCFQSARSRPCMELVKNNLTRILSNL